MTEPPIRIDYILAVARALVALGGSATPRQVYDWISQNDLRRMQVPPEGINAAQHYEREVRFARQDLRDGGLLCTVQGQWQVKDVDGILSLTPDAVQEMIRQNRRNRRGRRVLRLHEKPDVSNELREKPPAVTKGPSPTDWIGEVKRAWGPADTYALRFGNTDVWKIGFASDVHARVSAINRHIPIELLDDCWELMIICHWPNQLAAYAMEQEILKILATERTIFERVRCSLDRLMSVWERAHLTIDRQQSVRATTAPGPDKTSTKGRPKASQQPTTR